MVMILKFQAVLLYDCMVSVYSPIKEHVEWQKTSLKKKEKPPDSWPALKLCLFLSDFGGAFIQTHYTKNTLAPSQLCRSRSAFDSLQTAVCSQE